MKLCFYYENIVLFLNLCPNVDCPLLCFKKYWAAFSLKCPKRYILGYLLIKLHKNAKLMMSIFNGRRTKLDFLTVCSTYASVSLK